jgi:hypothetical protein
LKGLTILLLQTAALAKHGGINDNDNSGVIKYVRIEFGGLAI